MYEYFHMVHAVILPKKSWENRLYTVGKTREVLQHERKMGAISALC
jgi:hypothetical protein